MKSAPKVNIDASHNHIKYVPIYILLYADSFSHFAFPICIDMAPEWQLYQNPTGLLIIIQFLDSLHDLFNRSFRRQADVSEFNSDFLSRFRFHPNIHTRIGSRACLHNYKLGLEPRVRAL